ncbi:Predicted arabinose efflux permease, MFS family [Mucilaginibacter gossypiicola]|uniref:Predicted arabinose efflux permease, MFS family n=1 Tax=Mucilaginibacter gossypiicola TaxID=551995 RepID=A0A1H8HS56_9SPHI|nr:MFS transporter [Mucilaginibacter gossypiicola]SEN59140.1 Predicted arabinose efflux permease, MFS family [Mucilaginibacter gossypiicola]
MSTLTIDGQVAKPQTSLSATYKVVLFAICFFSTTLGGSVSTLMSVYLPVVVKDLQGTVPADEINAISGYINAIFIFGWAFGGFTWGVISDKMGRKKALLLAIGSYGVFTILTGLMPTWWGVLLCRFFSGFGVGGVLVTSITLVSEVWPAKSKAVIIGILSIAFPVGIFSAGLINLIVSSWRSGFLVGVIPLTLALIGALVLNESENWLNYRNDIANRENPLNKLLSKNHRRELIVGSLTFGTMLIGLWAIFSWLPTWVQSLITDHDAAKERGLSMMCMGMGGLTGGFFSGWLVNLLSIKRSMVICFAVCAGMSFILFKTNTTFSAAVYIEIIILALFFGASQGVLSAYIPQLFSTGIRATATGFCFNIGRIFTATAVLFVGVLVSTLGGYGNALIIFSLVFIVGLLVVIFGHEKAEDMKQKA